MLETDRHMISREIPLPSPLYFKVIIKETRERSRICDAISQFLDDYAHAEEAFGKSLVKAGSNSLTQSKQDWPNSTNGAWNNISIFTEKLGKQHIGYATCLSQSISRSFLEHSKISVAALGAIDVKIQALYHDLTKAKTKYDRNHSKYLALVQDTENAIRSRDSSVHDYASKGERDIDVYDGFLKRSVTKMKGSMQTMGKFGPADALRKMDERCLAQLEEIDICEDSLATAATVHNQIRKDLMNELTQCTIQIENLERSRIEFMKEGLARFCLACQGMLDHVDLLIAEQIEQTASIDFEAEVVDLHLDKIQVAKSSQEPEAIDSYLTAIAVIDKVKDGMDSMKGLIQRFSNTMIEVSDAGKKYSKNCTRLSDRHGSNASAISKGTALSDTAAMLRVGPAIPSAQPAGALLSSIEAPHVRKGWEMVISSISKFAEAHQTGSEVISEKCCSSAESLQRRIDASKKDMIDTLSANSKRVDTLKKGLISTSKKLNRVRAELETLRSSTGSTQNASAVNTAQVAGSPPEKGYMSGDDYLSPDDDGPVISATKVDSPVVVPHPDPVDNQDLSAAKPFKQRSASMLLPSIAALDPLKIGSKLGAAVGFESASDRKVNRISTLEEEENRLAETESASLTAFESILESSVAELGSVAENSKQNVSRDLLNIKMVLQILMDCHRLSLEICQKVVLNIRTEYELILTDADFDHFMCLCRATTSAIADGTSTYVLDAHSGGTKASFATFEIPYEETFTPVVNNTVNLERQLRSTALSPTGEERGQSPNFPLDDIPNVAAADAGTVIVNYVEGAEAFDGTNVLETGLEITSNGAPPSMATTSKKRKSKTKKTASFTSPETSLACEEDIKSSTAQSANLSSKIVLDDASNIDDSNKMLNESNVEVAVLNTANEKRTDAEDNNILKTDVLVLASPRKAIFEHVDESAKSPAPSPDRQIAVSTLNAASDMHTPLSSPGINGTKSVNPFYSGPSYPTEETGDLLPIAEQAEKTLESFSCALYPKRGMMTHGRISITTKHLVFAGWPECRVTVPLLNISSVEKTNSLMIIPNALLIKVISGDEYFFGSFMERELCFTLLTSMVEVSKGLQEITAPDEMKIKKEHSDDEINEAIDGSNSVSADLLEGDGIKSDAGDIDDEISSDGHDHTTADFEKMFQRDGVVHMHTQDLLLKSKHIWSHFWLRAQGFADFLIHQGDKNISFTEWEQCRDQPVEDLCKINYQYCRKMDFFHPRTDPMVSFMGPENASAQQVQYLFVNRPCERGTDLSQMRYHSGIILTVTQFEHIPMADVFKVLQYWSFEPKKGPSSLANPISVVRMYVAIHYNKYTMLKSKILSGTKDDLEVLVKQWTVYVLENVKKNATPKKKSKRPRKSSVRGEMVTVAGAGDNHFAELFAETNGKVDNVDKILKDFIQLQKSSNATALNIMLALSLIVGIQFLVIVRLWTRS